MNDKYFYQVVIMLILILYGGKVENKNMNFAHDKNRQ